MEYKNATCYPFLSWFLILKASVLAISFIKNNYLMISMVIICKDCGFYAGIIPGTMQWVIILAFLWTQNHQIRCVKTPLEQFNIFYYNSQMILQTASGFLSLITCM